MYIVTCFSLLVGFAVYISTLRAIPDDYNSTTLILPTPTALQAAASTIILPQALPLPSGIPATTTSATNCFLPGEQDQYKKYLDQTRIKVSGCNVGVIAPQETLIAYGLYEQNTNGSDFSCSLLRQNYFSSAYTDLYVKELQSMVDTFELQEANPLQDTNSRESMCVANMIFT